MIKKTAVSLGDTMKEKSTITLHQGNCLKILKTISDKSIDLILTDPPFGTTDCKWDNKIDNQKLWEQLNRVIKPNGAILLFGQEPFSTSLRNSNLKNFRYDYIWIKNKKGGFMNCRKMPLRQYKKFQFFIINYQLIIPKDLFV